jgi:hypothetical protein
VFSYVYWVFSDIDRPHETKFVHVTRCAILLCVISFAIYFYEVSYPRPHDTRDFFFVSNRGLSALLMGWHAISLIAFIFQMVQLRYARSDVQWMHVERSAGKNLERRIPTVKERRVRAFIAMCIALAEVFLAMLLSGLRA